MSNHEKYGKVTLSVRAAGEGSSDGDETREAALVTDQYGERKPSIGQFFKPSELGVEGFDELCSPHAGNIMCGAPVSRLNELREVLRRQEGEAET